jgi:hypothetical protein
VKPEPGHRRSLWGATRGGLRANGPPEAAAKGYTTQFNRQYSCRLPLKGLVSKRADRPYRAGRSPDWIKVKNRKHAAMSRVLDAV